MFVDQEALIGSGGDAGPSSPILNGFSPIKRKNEELLGGGDDYHSTEVRNSTQNRLPHEEFFNSN